MQGEIKPYQKVNLDSMREEIQADHLDGCEGI